MARTSEHRIQQSAWPSLTPLPTGSLPPHMRGLKGVISEVSTLTVWRGLMGAPQPFVRTS